MEIVFHVPGPPVPKARPRTVRTKSGRTVTYTPGETVLYENRVRAAAHAVAPGELLDGPVRLEVMFLFARPKSRPKKHRYPDVRPDLENLLKAVMDALTGIVWRDDAQVVDVSALKLYGPTPGTNVRVSTVGGGEKR